ncbi:AraC family transcriptional regulator [Weissella paramesenteroides]|uniref:AraC family transcriptional regulator n=1 Tax=Weissella paramesenteroides TaxID=1249 RepID=UPI003F26F335
MSKKVYKFNIESPMNFFKAGQYFANNGWKHKDVVNDGDYELFIMLEGAAYIQIESQQFELHENDCLLIPPYIRHFGYKGSPANTTYYWMHFYSNEKCSEFLEDDFSWKDDFHKKKEVILCQKLFINDFTRIAVLIRQLLDSANRKDTLYSMADYFITCILIELSNQYYMNNKESKVKYDADTSRFELIKNWIRIHSHEEITVTKVAEEFEMSSTYLTHLFNKFENTSTIHFINLTKVNESQELLTTTDLPVKAIAIKLGFQNEKYFFRLFKHLTGITPRQFRNSYSKTYLNNIEVDPSIKKPTDKN